MVPESYYVALSAVLFAWACWACSSAATRS